MTLQRIKTIAKVTINPLQAGYRSSNALNSNLTAIQAALEKTLSRDGTAPNQMEATLDMNSQRIINLPAPVGATEAARHGDIQQYVTQAQTAATASSSSATDSAAHATAASTSAASAASSATASANSATDARASKDAAAASALSVNVDGIPALGQWQRFIAKIKNGNEDANIVLVGDSTGDATTEWYYLLATSLGLLYPTHTVQHRLWNVAGDVYDAATTIQTGTGTRTITFWNGSVAGSVANYFSGSRFAGGVQNAAPDVVVTSYGHNGGLTAQRQLSFYDSIAYTLRTRLPDTPVVQIGQNPTLSDETMAAKVSVFRDFAARNGWGFISVHDAFKQAGVALSTLLADEVHPNAAGSALWRDTVLDSLRASSAVESGGSTVAPTLIRAWTTFADFNTWSKSNATLAADSGAGFYETAGASAKLTTTSTLSPGYLFTTAVTSDDAPAYANKYVTFSVWQNVPIGNVSGSGRVEIEDDTGATVSTGALQGPGFIVFTVTRKIAATATFIKLYYYSADAAGSPANVTYLDRASLTMGLTPVDPLSTIELSARYIRNYGGNAAGVQSIYNSASSGTGLQIVASTVASPETGYAASLSADGLKVKTEADAFDRVAVGLSGLRFGSGAAATDMGIDRQLSGIMRFSGADLYPDTTALRYLGAASNQWRAVYSAEGLLVANLQVVGPRNVGWTAATGTGSKGAFAAAAAGTASATYVQAELQGALNRIAALEARLKALDDAMFAHGLIGV